MKKTFYLLMTLLLIVTLTPSLFSAKPGPGFYIEPPEGGGGGTQEPQENWVVNSTKQAYFIDENGNAITKSIFSNMPTFVEIYVRPIDGLAIDIYNETNLYVKIKPVNGMTFPNFYKVDGVAQSYGDITGPGLWMVKSVELFVLMYEDGYSNSSATSQLNQYNKISTLMDCTAAYKIYYPVGYGTVNIGASYSGTYWSGYMSADEDVFLTTQSPIQNGNTKYVQVHEDSQTNSVILYSGGFNIFSASINSYSSYSDLPTLDTNPLNRDLVIFEFGF